LTLTAAPFAGETIEVTIRAARTTGQVVREGTAEVGFWPPGRSTDQSPAHTLPAAWDSAARGFTALADTDGWAPGLWLYRGRVIADTDRGPVTVLTEFNRELGRSFAVPRLG